MGERPHLLLVDDEAGFRFSAGVALRTAGFRITEASDGREALLFIVGSRLRGAEPVDLVLSDIQMPRMSGLELVEGIRGYGIDTPILLFSGYADRPMMERLRAMGFSDFMEKPFGPESLLDKIEEILGRTDEDEAAG